MSLGLIMDFLSYDSETGLFTWKDRPNSKGGGAKIGDLAGCENTQGYIVIRFKRVLYLAHRLAWFFVHGQMPKRLDHKNLNKADNRISNLRIATFQQNAANMTVQKRTASKYKGVYLHKNSRYYAYVIVNRKKINLGAFGVAEDAANAYDLAAIKYFGEFANTNFKRGHDHGRPN